ncbi:MAG: flavodoxin family protein [Anaerolineae bacterium]|nr:flavodoxin family protein [Anaerolineae bacterium]
MKILALMGSYRKKGNTARIVDMIRAHMETVAASSGQVIEFETINLGHVDLQPCRGCRSCFDRGEEKCPVKDDFAAIRAAMDAADGILVASPVYVDDVNGITKNWIDRLAYLCHRPGLADKCFYLVATVASSPTRRTLRTMSLAAGTWGAYIVGQAGFRMGALMPKDKVESQYRDRVAEVAEALFRAVSEQAYLRPSFLSLMIFRIQQRAWGKELPGTVDHTYWLERGWLEPRCTYYIDHHTGRAKVALARLAGAALAPFVTS